MIHLENHLHDQQGCAGQRSDTVVYKQLGSSEQAAPTQPV